MTGNSLKTALAIGLVAIGLSAGARSSAQSQPAGFALPFTLKQLGPGVYAAIDGPKGVAGSNAGFVIGSDGVLVIDSFYDPAAAKALLGAIRRLTPVPIRYVVNTHFHIDHTGGDAEMRAAGAIIIAHRNERGWVRTENAHLFGKGVTPAIQARIAALALPDVTTDQVMTVWLGSRRVDVRPVLGHTGGDLAVSVPDAKILFAGDLLWQHVSPNIVDGNVADWITTVDSMAADPGVTTFVPGHGDVATAADVTTFAGYLRDLRSSVSEARKTGLSGDALVGKVLPPLKTKYGAWQAFDYFAPLEIGFMNDELAGTKRRPVPSSQP